MDGKASLGSSGRLSHDHNSEVLLWLFGLSDLDLGIRASAMLLVPAHHCRVSVTAENDPPVKQCLLSGHPMVVPFH